MHAYIIENQLRQLKCSFKSRFADCGVALSVDSVAQPGMCSFEARDLLLNSRCYWYSLPPHAVFALSTHTNAPILVVALPTHQSPTVPTIRIVSPTAFHCHASTACGFYHRIIARKRDASQLSGLSARDVCVNMFCVYRT